MARESPPEQLDRSNLRFAMHTSWIMAALGTVALVFGIAAVPITGANCPDDCIAYPYLDTLDRFPRDYLWIYFAIALMIAYLFFMISLRAVAAARSGVVGQVTVALTAIASTVLVMTYFTQSTVVPASLAAGETAGLELLTMYNPHGLFIALEEIGYLLMSLSFLFAARMVTGIGKMQRAIQWVFAAGFVIPVLGLIAYSVAYGLDRQDRFEVLVLSANWLVLITNGVLVALLLRNRLRTNPGLSPPQSA